METTTFSNARNNFKDVISNVCKDHSPILVTNQSTKDSVVIISLEDYNAMEETNYLMKSPKNAQRLSNSINSLEKGKGLTKELVED